MASSNTQYYVTESDVSRMMAQSGLPEQFRNIFTRDYVSIKRDIASGGQDLNQLTADVELLKVRVTSVESDILSVNSRLDVIDIDIDGIEVRLDLIEIDLPQLRSDFDAHVADRITHGVAGFIIGTDDYCTEILGGSVLRASAVANFPTTGISVVTTPNAAGLAYSQADAATCVATLNELKNDFNDLIVDYNNLIGRFNSSLATERTA